MKGTDLKSLRLEAELTQPQLAEQLEVSVRTIATWEALYVPPSRVRKVREAFGLPQPAPTVPAGPEGGPRGHRQAVGLASGRRRSRQPEEKMQIALACLFINGHGEDVSDADVARKLEAPEWGESTTCTIGLPRIVAQVDISAGEVFLSVESKPDYMTKTRAVAFVCSSLTDSSEKPSDLKIRRGVLPSTP